MYMYNTNFKVKYYNIEQDLLNKLKVTPFEEHYINYHDSDINEYGYTKKDVLTICDKLYRDELLSVFGLNEIDNETLFRSMSYVYNIIITHHKLNEIINEIKNILTNGIFGDKIVVQEHYTQLLIITLFSYNTFYITHKCICQYIQFNTIDDNLLVEIRTQLINGVRHNCNI